MKHVKFSLFCWVILVTWGTIGLSAETGILSPEAAEELVFQGDQAVLNSQFQEALQAYEQARRVFQQAGEQRDELNTLLRIGNVHDKLYRYQASLEAFQQAYTIAREQKLPFSEGLSLQGLGDAYRAQMLLPDAVRNYRDAQKALQAARLEHTDPSKREDILFREIFVLTSLANAYADFGQYWDANNHYQQALTLLASIAGNPYAPTIKAGILRDYATASMRLGQYEQALDYAQQALSIFQTVLMDPENSAYVMMTMGGIYEEWGRRDPLYFSKAINSYKTAFTVLSELSRPEEEGILFNNIGKAYDAFGTASQDPESHTDALAYYEKALAIFKAIGKAELSGKTLSNIGETHLHLSSYEQREHHLQQARQALQEALKIQQGILDSPRIWGTLSLLGALDEEYGKTETAIRHSRDAIEILERIIKEAGLADFKVSLRDHEQAEETFQRIVRLSMEHEATYQQAFEYTERARARAFLDQLGTKRRPDAREQSSEDDALISVETLGLTEIWKHLDPETTLLSYFVTKNRIFAFVVDQSSLKAVELEILQSDLFKKIEAVRRPAAPQAALPGELTDLYAGLIAPVKSLLTTPNIAIVAHNILHYLPFAALTDGERYFGDEYTLAFLPSAGMLQFLQPAPKAATNIVAFANNHAPGYPKLHYAEAETLTLLRMHPARVFLGVNASETNLKKLAGTASILQLAAHGILDTDAPLNSRILLKEDAANDGNLSVHEVYDLNLDAAKLVILSACETNLGKQSKGDDIVGLTRTFLYAGAQSVISSVWKVPDQATYLLITSFYLHLKAGKSRAEALQAAQHNVRAQYPHPYYWAGFLLTGNPGRSSTDHPLMFALLFALLGGGIVLGARQLIRQALQK